MRPIIEREAAAEAEARATSLPPLDSAAAPVPDAALPDAIREALDVLVEAVRVYERADSKLVDWGVSAARARVEAALRPFATFVFGPGWAGHAMVERDGDTNVLCGYDAEGKTTGIDVNYSDFMRARAALAEGGA